MVSYVRMCAQCNSLVTKIGFLGHGAWQGEGRWVDVKAASTGQMNQRIIVSIALLAVGCCPAVQAQQGMSVQVGSPWITGGQSAFTGSVAPAFSAGPPAAVPLTPGATGGMSGSDLVRLQQARHAHGNYVRNVGGYGRYGSHGESVERIDNAFAANGKYLSEYDYYDLVRRYDTLKENVTKSVAKGDSDSQYQSELQTFEEDLTQRVNESLATIEQAKKQVSESIEQLDTAFSSARSKLSESDAADLSRKIKALKERGAADNVGLSGSAALQLIAEARQLQSTIDSRSSSPTVLSGLGQSQDAPAAAASAEHKTSPAEADGANGPRTPRSNSGFTGGIAPRTPMVINNRIRRPRN